MGRWGDGETLQMEISFLPYSSEPSALEPFLGRWGDNLTTVLINFYICAIIFNINFKICFPFFFCKQ
ncbi:MAG: hypothetical protein F6J89_27795 [Symploca sp. SIO1C4]|uniref:Uncharacterized protein n=1 Tax=Symploca sp. SIO1C4 TaxID=2607765 RepID=A0A6B3NDX4_9CYAN|nr:hypothetical protein [Symploca sp. SIO1C4]